MKKVLVVFLVAVLAISFGVMTGCQKAAEMKEKAVEKATEAKEKVVEKADEAKKQTDEKMKGAAEKAGIGPKKKAAEGC